MPPNGDTDPILQDRGIGEEAKMCKKDDAANSPATGQSSVARPVSGMTTPLDTGTGMDEPSRNFLNALTDGTSVPVKTISFDDERSFDERLMPQLQANAKQIHEKNREWWNNLSMDNFYPLGEAHPYDTPNKYANLTFSLQRLFNNSHEALAIFKRQINEDGIFARETFAILRQMAVKYPANKKAISKIPELHELVKNLSAQLNSLRSDKSTVGLVIELEEHLKTVIIKPEKIVRWNYESSVQALIDFFRFNYKNNGTVQQGIHFDSSFYGIIRFLSKTDEEAEHIAEMLTLEQKLDMISTLYREQNVDASAVYFEVGRYFTHYEDLMELNPNKNYKEFSFNFMLNTGQLVDEVEPVLKIKFPSWGIVTKTRERSRQLGQPAEEVDKTKDKVNESGGPIISLALYHYLPKIKPAQRAAAKALIDLYVMEKNTEQQAALNFLKDIEADIVLRKTQPADISEYQVLMDVLTYSVASRGAPSAETEALIQRAQNTFFLTVKLDEKADEPFILSLRQIITSNDQAVYNDSYAIKIGDFKPPPQSGYRVDNSNLTAEREEEEIKVTLSGHNQPWPLRRFKSLEPVRVDIGVINPDVGTATLFVREFFTEYVWHVQTMWFVSDSLPDVLRKLREDLDFALAMKGLDLVLTSAFLAAGLAGAFLGATGTGLTGPIGARAIVPLSRGLLKEVFWFVLSETLMAKMMAFDKTINTDKENYDDEDRARWNTFKVGLFIFGGAMLVRQAWKGLKFAGSKLFRSSLTELELELLKKAMTRPLPPTQALTRMLSAKTAALAASKKWAKETLELTANTLRDLTEEAVTRLKQLPDWALNFIKEMKDDVIRKLFGCASFCKVDLTAIKNQLIEVVVTKLKIDSIKGILAVEKEFLKNLSFEVWDRIIKYAIRNRNYFSVKGKIAEELFMMKAEFRKIYDDAILAAEARGIHPRDMEFVQIVKGFAPFQNPKVFKAAGGEERIIKGVWAELTDGMLVGIKRNVDGKGEDELHILAVFESKSPSNMDQLAKGKWEYLGQMEKDFERIRQNGIKIIFNGEEKLFPQGAVRISRNTTQWVGVIPPGYQLSNELVKRLKAGLPGVQIIEGPIRNDILNDLAEALKAIINYLPKKK